MQPPNISVQQIDYKKKVLWLIVLLSVLRLIFAFWIELANDESYYWLYGQNLKWNYFDHPPMIALWLKIFTVNLTFQSPGFLRLGSVISCAVASWFMFKCVALLSNERAGFFAACLYNASFYSGITAGFLVMPDTPQMVFWTLSFWLIAKLTLDDAKLLNWILVGISIGFCIMSKVHGVFIWIGLGLYTLIYKRNWLAKPGLYLSVLISIVICLPILFWNIKYHFATYAFNSGRVDLNDSTINRTDLFHEIIMEIGVNNPFNILILVIALFGWKRFQLNTIPSLKIFNLVGLPFALLLLYLPIIKQGILPHWSGPAYVSLMPVAAIAFDRIKLPSILPKLIGLTVLNYVLYTILCSLFILYYPGTVGDTSKPKVGNNDLSVDFFGWKEGGEQFDNLYQSEVKQKIIPANTPVVCYKWWGAHLEYYFCRPLHIKMIGLGNMMDIHEYMWMNKFRIDSVDMNNAYCIVPSDEYFNPKMAYKNYYNNINFIKEISVLRSGKPAHDFYIYRLSGWKGNVPVIN